MKKRLQIQREGQRQGVMDEGEEDDISAITPGLHGMFLFFFHINCRTVG